MTDRRPDTSDDLLPARLAGWFDQEVRQAAADLRAAPLAGFRGRRAGARIPFAPLAAVALLVIVVVAGLTRLPGVTPGMEPTGSSGSGAPSATTAPSASGPGSTAEPDNVVGSRYPDGIPSSLGGRYVARPSNIDREPADDRSFLLGGWSFDFSAIVYSCAIQIGTPPPFGPRCGTPFLAQNPLMDENPRVMLDGTALGAGPVVVQVHRYDARSAGCDAARRAGCEAMAVIEKVVWTGDAVTEAAPRTATDTFMRLIGADPNLPQATITAVGSIVRVAPGGPPPPSASPDTRRHPFTGDCRPHYPAQAWTVDGSWIGTVMVFPTTAAREAVDGDFLASGFIGTSTAGSSCQVTTDGLFLTRWVAVDNVMVGVRVPVSSTAPEVRSDAVRAALTR